VLAVQLGTVTPEEAVNTNMGADLRRKRATSMPAEERRQMIIDATLPILLQQGETVTTKDIAEAAGIAEGTIFRVFASKEALIDAVVDQAFDPEPMERAIEALAADLSLEEAVTQVVALFQRRVVDIWQLMSGVGGRHHRHDRRPPVESPALVRLLESHRAELSVKPVLAARLLRSFTLAMTHPMITTERVKPAEVARRFLYGVVSAPC
jgi:AcrR family transcriptional regulator